MFDSMLPQCVIGCVCVFGFLVVVLMELQAIHLSKQQEEGLESLSDNPGVDSDRVDERFLSLQSSFKRHFNSN